jgi:cytochrome oxidase Cu insertion factor (SCO1/SenC/PrrC family)
LEDRLVSLSSDSGPDPFYADPALFFKAAVLVGIIKFRVGASALFCFLFLSVSPSLVSAGPADEPTALSELSIGSYVRNYRLVDHNGDYVPFFKFKGGPVLVSFMYIDCKGPCHLINQSLKNLLKSLSPGVASKTTILSMSLDSQNDPPARLREYGFEFSGGAKNWVFATASVDTLNSMVKDLGFTYKKITTGIDHLNRLTLVGPEGKVLTHFYGVDYKPATVEKALSDAIAGRGVTAVVTDAFNTLMLFCSTYDPATDTYKVNKFLLISIGVQYLLVMGTLIYVFRGKLFRLTSFFLHHNR